MTESSSKSLTRRGLIGAFAATAMVAAPTYSNAFGFLRGAGDVRRVRMYSGRTGERLDTIYWIEGEYIGEALREITSFMRDWRTGTTMNIDTRTIDIIAATHNLLDVSEPYMLLSGYRSPQTNAMLRAALLGGGAELAAPARSGGGPSALGPVGQPDRPGRGIVPCRRASGAIRGRTSSIWIAAPSEAGAPDQPFAAPIAFGAASQDASA